MLGSLAGAAQEANPSENTKAGIITSPVSPRRVCLVVGAAGEPEYGEEFQKWANRIRSAMKDGDWLNLDGVEDRVEPDGDSASTGTETASHRELILRWIREAPDTSGENWFVFLGHGTHEGKVTQLNLLGPDLSSTELADALRGKEGKWVFVFCNSSSAPFLASIAGPNRVVVTATKSGAEQNFSRFGDYFSQALSDTTSDLDHDNALSVLEVFLTASNGVAKYYEDRGLLATEQALLDDTGDGRGTPAVFYRGLRAVKGPADKASLDGNLAKRITIDGESVVRFSTDWFERRDKLEEELERLRSRKGDMDIDEYYGEIERVFLLLARIKAESEKR
ncbi:MAG: hypothetical protein ACK52S_15150 [Pirellula sp.]